MSDGGLEYWQRFGPSWRSRTPAYDRSIQLPPSSRKGLASAAATSGNVAPGVEALERGVLMLRDDNLAGRQALVDGFLWIVEAMDRHGYVDLDDDDEDERPTAAEIASAIELAEYAIRRLRQGYEKAAFDGLADAIGCLGGRVTL